MLELLCIGFTLLCLGSWLVLYGIIYFSKQGERERVRPLAEETSDGPE